MRRFSRKGIETCKRSFLFLWKRRYLCTLSLSLSFFLILGCGLFISRAPSPSPALSPPPSKERRLISFFREHDRKQYKDLLALRQEHQHTQKKQESLQKNLREQQAKLVETKRKATKQRETIERLKSKKEYKNTRNKLAKQKQHIHSLKETLHKQEEKTADWQNKYQKSQEEILVLSAREESSPLLTQIQSIEQRLEEKQKSFLSLKEQERSSRAYIQELHEEKRVKSEEEKALREKITLSTRELSVFGAQYSSLQKTLSQLQTEGGKWQKKHSELLLHYQEQERSFTKRHQRLRKSFDESKGEIALLQRQEEKRFQEVKTLALAKEELQDQYQQLFSLNQSSHEEVSTLHLEIANKEKEIEEIALIKREKEKLLLSFQKEEESWKEKEIQFLSQLQDQKKERKLKKTLLSEQMEKVQWQNHYQASQREVKQLSKLNTELSQRLRKKNSSMHELIKLRQELFQLKKVSLEAKKEKTKILKKQNEKDHSLLQLLQKKEYEVHELSQQLAGQKLLLEKRSQHYQELLSHSQTLQQEIASLQKTENIAQKDESPNYLATPGKNLTQIAANYYKPGDLWKENSTQSLK